MDLQLCKESYPSIYILLLICPNPKFPNDATSKIYLDNGLSDFDLNNNKVINLKKATHNHYSVNLDQLNEAVSAVALTKRLLFSKKDGSSLESDLSVKSKEITNVASPTQSDDAANKKYIDQKVADSHISTHENRKKGFIICHG